MTRRKLLKHSVAAGASLSALQLKWTALNVQVSVGYTLLAGTYFCLLLVVLLGPNHTPAWLFRRRWLVWLGGVSYCTYLIHEPVRYGLFYALGRGQPAIESLATLSLTLLSMGIVLGIAQVSSQYLERPLIQRAHRRHRYDSPSPEGGGLCVRTT